MLRNLINTTLAIGYGLYLTANLSRAEKQNLKAELQAKRQPTPPTAPLNEIIETPTAPATETAPESQIEITDPWNTSSESHTRPRWTHTGTIHQITSQLSLPAGRNFNTFTVKELKEVAKGKNIKAYYKMSKAELVKALTV